MTDSERLAMVYKHIDERLAYLSRLIYHHGCNIIEPDVDQQADFLMALGERRALTDLSHKLMGLTANVS